MDIIFCNPRRGTRYTVEKARILRQSHFQTVLDVLPMYCLSFVCFFRSCLSLPTVVGLGARTAEFPEEQEVVSRGHEKLPQLVVISTLITIGACIMKLV